MKKIKQMVALLWLCGSMQNGYSQAAARTLDPAELLKIAERKDANAKNWVALGDVLMQNARENVSHDFSKPAEAYTKALSMDANSTDAMLGMAWVKNSEHLFEQGRGWAEKALAWDKNLVDAHALLGDYKLELGDYDEAFDHYQQALDLRLDLSTYSRAAHLLWETGDSARAQILMRKAVSLGGPYPENEAWCRLEVAIMDFKTGAILPAEIEVKKALVITPDNPRALSMQGMLLAAQEDFQGAIAAYEKSVAASPTHQALSALVDLYAVTESPKREEAIKNVIAYHRPDPNKQEGGVLPHGHYHQNGQASAEFALFLADNDIDAAEGLKEAQKAYETYKNIRVADALAWCLYKTGDFRKARLMMERAMKWNTQDPELFFHCGMIHLKLGDRIKAEKFLEQAISLNPNFDPIDADTALEALDSLASKPAERSGVDVPKEAVTDKQ